MKKLRLNVNTITEPARDLPVYADVDVLIMGGGPGGIAAALAAAGTGAKTLIVERYAFLGGMGTQGLFSHWPRDRGIGMQPYGGVPQMVVDRLVQEDSIYIPEIKPRRPREVASYNDAYYNEEMLKLVLGEMMEQAGVQVLYNSPGVAPIMEESRILGVIIENKNGRSAILAKAVVDATGDGDIAARAGAPYAKFALGAPVTPFELHFVLCNIDWTRVDKQQVQEAWNRAYAPGSGSLVRYDKGYKRGERWREGLATFDLTMLGKDCSDAEDLNYGEIELKKATLNFVRTLRECPGFEHAHLLKLCHQAEVRGSRRIQGDYSLSKADVLEGRRFPDCIAVSHPRNRHVRTALADAPIGTQIWHGIPYRCLVPRKVEGLLTAGRCISTEYEAVHGHLSMIGCMVVGQASGLAAALAAENDITPRQVDVPTLQSKLRGMGAELDKGLEVV